MTLLAGTWAAVFVSYIVVLVLRSWYGRSEDDRIHVLDGQSQVLTHQAEIAHKLDVLDRWKTILLTISLVYGLAIGIYHLYTVWMDGSTTRVA